jgi:histidinol-phosphate aminotransferase
VSRVVVITGSSRGIGRELAIACGARGERVVVHGRDRTRIDEVVAEITTAGGDARGVVADLAARGGAEALITAARAAYGRIDILVNNAASSTARAQLWEVDAAEVESVVASNLLAPVLCARALLAWAVPAKQPVRIVNVSSAIVGSVREHAVAYVATKAGLDALTRALALDTAGLDVVVTGVALSGHRTDLTRAMLPAAEVDRLPSATAAATKLLYAALGPADEVHGRVLEDRTPPVLDIDAVDLLGHPSGPSPRAREALAEVARTGPLDRYPTPPSALRKVIAARHGVALDATIVGGGIGELLSRTVGTLTRAGDAVVANTPSWPMFPYLCRTHALSWRQVTYRIDNGRADHDLDAILAAIDRSVRLVYLTSPGNPGGAAIDADAFERFVAQVPRHVTLVVDEAYVEFAVRDNVLDATRYVRWLDKPLVVLRTFSKIHGLAGLRIGYALATREPAQALAREAPPFLVVRGVEEAAIAALNDTEHIRRTRDHVATARTQLEADLDARGIARLASDAPFILAADPQRDGPRFFDGRYVMLPFEWAATPTS